MHRMKFISACVLAVVVATIFAAVPVAYSTSSSKWAITPVPFYINPANADVSTSAATTALQEAMNVWNTQSTTNFRFSYAGQVNTTTTGNDGRNVILFRDSSDGSAIASTYSWSLNGVRVDSDIVFWDASRKFFTGTSGCSSGSYIEDIASHELGHSLGLSHSTVSGATMYPSYSSCSQALRTLSSDDIAGAQVLYPASATPTNTAPTVSIASPSNGVSVMEGTSMTFSASASDSQDGNLSQNLKWTSNLQGQFGTGSGFSNTLMAGTHTITASVNDSGGLSGSKQVSITVTVTASNPTPAPTPSGASLTATGRKDKGLQKVDLVWSGLTGSMVDMYRNGTKLFSTANDSSVTDPIDAKGGGSYTYKACEAGTSTCTNQATVTF